MVETGTGLHLSARDRDIKGVEGGDPVTALEAVGEDPDAIDFVVVSHLHYDHAGGMLGADGRPAFPNARYVVQRDEAQAAHGDELRLAWPHGARPARCRPGRRTAGGGAWHRRAGSGRHRHAHRRTHPRLAGRAAGDRPMASGERGIFFGDLIPTRWQLPIRWTSAYDDYPIEAVEIRRSSSPRRPTRGGGATSPTTRANSRSRSRPPRRGSSSARSERTVSGPAGLTHEYRAGARAGCGILATGHVSMRPDFRSSRRPPLRAAAILLAALLVITACDALGGVGGSPTPNGTTAARLHADADPAAQPAGRRRRARGHRPAVQHDHHRGRGQRARRSCTSPTTTS